VLTISLKKILKLTFIIAIPLCCSITFASHSKPSSELSKITNKIDSLKHNLVSMHSRQEDLTASLKQTEINLGDLAKKLTITKNQIADQKKQLSDTNRSLANLQIQLQNQKKLLANQIQAAYQLGHDPYIKILLNEENPEKLNRQLRYYQYICQARLDIIHRINFTTQAIKATTAKIQAHTKILQSTQLTEQKQQLTKQDERTKRQHLLNSIKTQITGTNKQLKQLYANKKHFEQVIYELSQHEQYGYAPGDTFTNMRHKLYWPTTSKHLLEYFNTPLVGGRIRSTGILIKENPGEQIHAIFSGKVVFADWLKGFGLLVIVQHGKNYLTLYGRNESLYVKAGDSVNAGDIIATAGNSGGFDSTALYFEVRYKGKPENPLLWLKKS